MKKINWRNLLDSGGVWIALFAFLAVASASNEYFRSPQNLVNITRQVSYSGIIALGMTFVIAAAASTSRSGRSSRWPESCRSSR